MFPSEQDQCPHAPVSPASIPSCVPTSKSGFPMTSKPGKLLSFYSGPNRKGRASEFLRANPSHVVQLDSSQPMLDLEPREPSLIRIHADACRIPLVGGQFSAVVG